MLLQIKLWHCSFKIFFQYSWKTQGLSANGLFGVVSDFASRGLEVPGRRRHLCPLKEQDKKGRLSDSLVALFSHGWIEILETQGMVYDVFWTRKLEAHAVTAGLMFLTVVRDWKDYIRVTADHFFLSPYHFPCCPCPGRWCSHWPWRCSRNV